MPRATTISATGLAERPARRYDLDWLRILAVLLLVPFHSAIIFSAFPDVQQVFVYDAQHSHFLTEAVGFVYLWHMPLLFLVAGAASWFALGQRTGKQYLGERVNRLLVPLGFGMVALIPLMLYLYIRTIPQLTARFPSFFQFYPHFFLLDPADLSGRTNGTLTPAHLWFIVYLLAYSCLALPLFLYLRRPTGQRLISRMAGFFARPATIWLLAIPLLLAATWSFLGDKNPLGYFLWFLYGYLLMADPRFQRTLDRHTVPSLLLAALTTVFIFTVGDRPCPTWSPLWLLQGLIFFGSRWFWVTGILGLGHRFLSKDSAVLRYASEAAYPFYILHLPINTAVGYLLRPWQVGVAIKYAAIVILTCLVTLAVYEVLVRRVGVMRFLFGLKSHGKARAALETQRGTLQP